ncbi:hypothetical protein [Abyssalbus ytuae]|uniref:YD repeat-containing protein n=1 Tax=Abyssalbus ytuae TaxID=2926907 RepID=A0A9E6ZKY7_9FLAO|nr:hypothetical protein [Abyssalbus ytuae]UOB17669.1 hypothetical protein MQE35_18250 [Abyssalbus ytuae]
MKKTSSIFKFILMIILSSGLNIVSGQYQSPTKPEEKVPTSPEVSELGRYGAIPVNKYTGLINMRIPLYEIDFDGLKIPVTLSYHSGGIRVNQEATWVGLGWNLQANPVISRTINGFDDLKTHSINAGFIYQSREAQYPQGVSQAFLTEQDASEIYGSYIPGSKPFDLEPDLFEVNLFGFNYKFRLQKLQPESSYIQAIVLNNNNVDIIYNDADKSFEITDERGFKFYFSTKDYSTTFSSEPYWAETIPQTVEEYALDEIPHHHLHNVKHTITAWSLDRIKSPFNNEINFNYQEGIHFTFPDFHKSLRIREQEYRSDTFWDITNNSSEVVSASTTGIENHYLTSITGDFGKIEFNLSTRKDLFNVAAFSELLEYNNWFFILEGGQITSTSPDLSRKLEAINVVSSTGKNIKNISFEYSYFNNHKLNSPNKTRYLRLKLDKLHMNEKNYSFYYDTPNGLPEKDTKSRDFWDFYNGVNNTKRVPSFNRFYYTHRNGNEYPYTSNDLNEIFVNYNGAIRKSDFNYGKIGMLTKVVYPTGGYSEFEYEGNRALIEAPQPYQIIETHPDGQIKKTNLNDEEKYKFTYQYLKKANDPSYKFFDHFYGEPTGEQVEISLGLNEQFSIASTSVLSIDATIQCYTGCHNAGFYMDHPFRIVRNTNTSQEYIIFKYGDSPSATGTTGVSKSVSIVLPPGNYKIESRTPQWDGNNPGIPALGVLEEQSSGAKPYILETTENTEDNINYNTAFEEFEVGGARIKSITNKNNNGAFISKKIFEYTTPGVNQNLSCSGILMDELIFHSKAYGYYSYTFEEFASSLTTISSSSTLRSTTSAQGSHIGYSFITEKNVDQSGNDIGRIETNYKNLPNQYYKESFCRPIYNANGIGGYNPPTVCYTSYIIGLNPKNEYSYINGNIMNEKLYDSSNNIISEVNNDYDILYGTIDNHHHTRVMPLYPYNDYYFINRFYYTYKTPPSNSAISVISFSEKKEILNGNELKTVTTSSYDTNKHHLKSQSRNNSLNETLLSEYYYPYDPEVSSKPYMNSLVSTNRISKPVYKRSFKNSKLLNENQTIYGKNSNTSNFVLPTKFQVSKEGNTFEDYMLYERYDSNGNILQYRQPNGTPITLIWGYNGQYPVAKIENALYVDVIGTGISLSVLNDLSSTQSQILQELEKIRNHSSMSNAMITTYIYDPLVGATSITDPKGNTTYYEYDDFQRLKFIKDEDEYPIEKYDYYYKY